MRNTFEYKVLWKPPLNAFNTAMIDELNVLGREGWHVVAVSPSGTEILLERTTGNLLPMDVTSIRFDNT